MNTSNFGSGGPRSKPRSSRYFLRQGTLHHFVSLHTGVEMGVGDILLGGGGGEPCDGLASLQGGGGSSNTPKYAPC